MRRVVILENIRSLHNVGAVFRNIDGAGWDKVFLCGYTGTPPDRRIEKVSLGAEEFIPWEKFEDVTKCIKKLKKEKFKIIALEQTKNSRNIFTENFENEKIALILGNEIEGISSESLKLCDDKLEIPMFGKKASLNVSVASGIAFYALSENN